MTTQTETDASVRCGRQTPLRADLNQLAARTSLNQQRHVIPQRSSIEPSISPPNDRGDGVRRHSWIFTHQSLDHLIDDRLFAQLDHHHRFASRSPSVNAERPNRTHSRPKLTTLRI